MTRRGILLVLGSIGVVLVGVFLSRSLWRPPTVPQSSAQRVSRHAAVHLPAVRFRDVTAEAGITFVHENGAFGEKLLPETMGGGCAVLDYDGDRDPDLLFVNSSRWEFAPRAASDARAAERPTMVLYQNDGHGRFRDVTAEVGLDVTFYGMGAAVGDYDNDGDADVFFSAVGRNRLFRNDDGRFVDVTDAAQVSGPADAWSTSCGWFDYDADGLLDLFVCNYVAWSREFDQSLASHIPGIGRAYGPPIPFRGTHSLLYHNEGGGTFRDVSAEAGIQVHSYDGSPAGKALGVTFPDVDGDGDQDIVVANDTVQNFYFENQGDGTFVENARIAGIAYDSAGQPRGAMGIDAGYFRNSKELGIAIGNFADEMSALYVTEPDQGATFTDAAVPTGFGPATELALTFGIFFFDYDLDGRLDILGANGHLEQEINKVLVDQQYEQPPQLFWNAGRGRGSEFVRVPEEVVSSDFARPMVGRGALHADFDADGDLDVLLTACGNRPRLLRNEQALGHHWLRIQLRGTRCNRDAIGAIVELHQNGVRQRRVVMPTCSYLSQVEAVVTFGLGKSSHVDRIVIHWPDGSRQEVVRPAVDQLLIIEQS